MTDRVLEIAWLTERRSSSARLLPVDVYVETSVSRIMSQVPLCVATASLGKGQLTTYVNLAIAVDR